MGNIMKKWSQLVAQVWADEKLKRRLMDNPATVLKEHGMEVPKGVEIRVVENTDKVYYLPLPPKPAGEVTELTGRPTKGDWVDYKSWDECVVCKFIPRQ